MTRSSRVLVVDDDPCGLEGLCEWLSGCGFDTHAASDGKHALEIAFTRRPDIIITDLSLPDGDACDVIRRVKATRIGAVVIAFSGWHHLEAAARDAGADAFVLKPDVEALESLLFGLRRARTMQDVQRAR